MEERMPDSPHDRFLIIPLIIRVAPQPPVGPDGKLPQHLTPDDVIDFFQGMEAFDGNFSKAFQAS